MAARSRSTSLLLPTLVLLLAVPLVGPREARALIALQENRLSGKINAEGCAEFREGICALPLNLTCSTDCEDRAGNRIQAAISQCVAGLPVGTRQITGVLYSDVMVPGLPATNDDYMTAEVQYDVWWNGTWCMGVSLEQIKDASVRLWLEVREGPLLIHREEVHSLNPDAQLSFFKGAVSAGLGTDKGSRQNSFTFLMKRGKPYRIQLALELRTELSVTVGFMGLDYRSELFDKGAGWNDLKIAVGQDARGVVANLAARIDTLQSRLEHHGHTYLTGRGEGHNNTEAQTGEAIFFEDVAETPDFVQPGGTPLPTRSMLYDSAPNPSESRSTILYELPQAAQVSMLVYDVGGRLVRTLVDERREAGKHSVELDTSGLTSGVYYYVLRANQYLETRRLVVVH
jgi:hypothetical protein